MSQTVSISSIGTFMHVWEKRQGCHSKEIKLFPDFSLNFKQFSLTFINDKQLITFALVFLQAINIFCFIFNLFLLFAERGRRNLEKIIYNENHWPQLLHKSGVECQIDSFAFFAAYFSSFPKENAFQSLEENLWTKYRKQNSLTFHWLWQYQRFSLSFPWPWQPWQRTDDDDDDDDEESDTDDVMMMSMWCLWYDNDNVIMMIIIMMMIMKITMMMTMWWR